MAQSKSRVKAYRLFYRNSKAGSGYFSSYRQEVIFGEEELARRQQLQRPRLVHWEVATLWRCHACRKRGPWVAGWRMMPGRTGGANGWAEPVTICSDECAEVHRPGYAPPRHVRTDDEPPPKRPKLMRARWDAFAVDRDAKARTREHRRVPLFYEKKPEGWCRWCGEEVEPPRRTWHDQCLQEFFLHTERTAQIRYLRKRGGGGCAAEGCEAEGEEVDHVTPLWRVRHLAPAERRPYFGPTNLQLLCYRHHKEKTAREAGERAQEKPPRPFTEN